MARIHTAYNVHQLLPAPAGLVARFLPTASYLEARKAENATTAQLNSSWEERPLPGPIDLPVVAYAVFDEIEVLNSDGREISKRRRVEPFVYANRLASDHLGPIDRFQHISGCTIGTVLLSQVDRYWQSHEDAPGEYEYYFADLYLNGQPYGFSG